MPNLLFIAGKTGFKTQFGNWLNELHLETPPLRVKYHGANVFVEAQDLQVKTMLESELVEQLPSLLVLHITDYSLDEKPEGYNGETNHIVLGKVGERQLTNNDKLLAVGASPKHFFGNPSP